MKMETQNEKIGYRDILRQKEYMKLIGANLINRFGDSIDAIAFTWLVYAVTGSAAWTTLIFALNQLPTVLLQPFAGTLVEGMHKKRVMVVSDLIRGGIVALLAVFYVGNRVNPLILAVFTLIISSVEAFCLPASTAFIPKVLDKKYYAFGTSLNATASRALELVGVALGGILIAELGVQTAMAIDSATFIGSGIIIACIRAREERPEKAAVDLNSYFTSMKEGFSYVKNKKVVLNFCILAAFANIMFVPFNSLQSAMVVEIYGVGSELLSVFGFVWVAGMGLGAIVFPYIFDKLHPRIMIGIFGTILGIFYAMLTLGRFTYGDLLMSSILCGSVTFGFAICSSLVIETIHVQFMKNVEEEYLARASAIMGSVGAAATPVMSFVVSAVLVKLSVSSIFIIFGIGCTAVFALTYFLRVQLTEEKYVSCDHDSTCDNPGNWVDQDQNPELMDRAADC